MKVKNIIIFTLCIWVGTIIFSPAIFSAATLKINMINLLSSSNLAKLGQTDPDKIIVTDMEEDPKYYYFLLTDETIEEGVAILKINKPDFSITEVISVYDAESLKGHTIESMSIGNNETIWLHLSGDGIQRACMINNSGKIATIDYAYNSLTKHGTNSVLWLENGSNIIHRWDGEQTKTYNISNRNVLDFTEHENQLFYLDTNGKVNLIKDNGETQIADLSSLLNIQDNDIGLEVGTILSAGGKLWASAGIMNHPNTGLINLTDKTIINEVSAGKIYKSMENADGSLYFLVEQFFPITPHGTPSGDTLQQLILSTNSELHIQTVNGYWEHIEQNYMDQLGNMWTFNLRGDNRGLIMTADDQTTIHYYFSGASIKSDIKVIFNETEIGFDVNPYIENGRTMVPLRGIAFLFGATTHWDDSTKTATFQKDEILIKLTLGEKVGYVNNKLVLLDTPVEIKDGRIMVPLRFVAESLLIKTNWDGSSRTISLNSN